MKFESYRCAHYKAFDDEVKVELRPLTLVFGHNSGGKSALVRLPRLILASLVTRSKQPVERRVDGLEFFDQFKSMVHGSDSTGKVVLGCRLSDGSKDLNIRVEVQNLYESRTGTHRGVVSALELTGAAQLELRWQPSAEPVLSYHGLSADAPVPIPFRGLLPEKSIAGIDLDYWRDVAGELFDRTEHLGPHRAACERSWAWTPDAALKRDGSGAPHWLRNAPDVEEEVGAWYAEHLGGQVSVQGQQQSFALLQQRGRALVNLADSGEGSQQVLPILVQHVRDRREEGGPLLAITEQPELHLHDAAQGPLADMFIDSVLAGRGPHLVETHSELFLMRVRRRVAERTLPHDKVAIYWLKADKQGKTRVERVVVQPDGSVEGWPRSVYDETFKELAAIRRAARAPAGS